jgi:nucleotide-binding universal stress UspA family protein
MAHTIKRILVPVDFNVPSRAALTLAGDLAEPLGASIEVLHVLDLPDEHVIASEGFVPLPDNYRQTVREEVGRRLVGWLATTTAPAAPSQVADGRPAVEIVRFALEHQIDLIIMGTHGRGGVAHFLTGSVTEKVIRTARCPVLAVRPPAAA